MIPTQHFRLKTRGLKVPVKHLADADGEEDKSPLSIADVSADGAGRALLARKPSEHVGTTVYHVLR
jgi:hypothetical protein